MASKSHATMLEVAIGGVGFFLIAQVQGCSAAQWLRPVNLLNPSAKNAGGLWWCHCFVDQGHQTGDPKRLPAIPLPLLS